MLLKKKTDLGRTMLEMLGVLGVIGILSIAAIQGYRYLNLHFEVSQIEDAIYKGVALVEGRQITSVSDLDAFFKKTKMGMGRQYQIKTVECSTDKAKRGVQCCALTFPNLNKNIVSHFLNDAGPFEAKSTAPSNLTLIFEIKSREAF